MFASLQKKYFMDNKKKKKRKKTKTTKRQLSVNLIPVVTV